MHPPLFPKWLSTILVVVMLGSGAALIRFQNKSTADRAEQTVPARDTSEMVARDQRYRNGTYHATGTYASPGGEESIGVDITLKEGVVTDVVVVAHATLPASQNYQQKFVEGARAVVVGKKIDALNLSVVSGSSLTPVGFMDALAKIKVQAKA